MPVPLFGIEMSEIVTIPERSGAAFALPRGATLGVIGSAGAVGRYAIQLAAALPMEQIQDAHRRLEAGGVRGRIVITA